MGDKKDMKKAQCSAAPRPWRYHRCKCGQCGTFHTDVVPATAEVVVQKHGEPFVRCECDYCLQRRVTPAQFDVYLTLRDAVVRRFGLMRDQ